MSRLKPEIITKASLVHGGRTVSIEVWRVTPTFARQELERANIGNRRMKKLQVEQIKHDIQQGHWITLTGEAVSYDEQDRLTNGQNRFQAIADSGEAVEVVVWRNLASEVKFVIDQGVMRTGADILGFSGQEKHLFTLSTALRMVAAWDSEPRYLEHSGIKTSRYRPWTKTDLLITAEKHPGLVDSVEWVHANRKSERLKPIPPAVLAFMHYETSLITKRGTKQFWQGYADNDFPNEEGDPRWMMWKKLSQVHDTKAHNKVQGIFVFCGFRAWNLWRDGLEAGSMLYYQRKTTVVGTRRQTTEKFFPIPEPH